MNTHGVVLREFPLGLPQVFTDGILSMVVTIVFGFRQGYSCQRYITKDGEPELLTLTIPLYHATDCPGTIHPLIEQS